MNAKRCKRIRHALSGLPVAKGRDGEKRTSLKLRVVPQVEVEE